MIKNTMKLKILKSNITVIIGFIVLTTIVFNIAIKIYIETDLRSQLHNIAMQAEDTAILKGPDFLPPKAPSPHDEKSNDPNSKGNYPPDGPKHVPPTIINASDSDKLFKFNFIINRSFKETLSILNADFVFLDTEKNTIDTGKSGYDSLSDTVINNIKNEIQNNKRKNQEFNTYFSLEGTKYIAVVKPVSHKNSLDLGWIIIFSSISKIIQLQVVINIILVIILILSSFIGAIFSSNAARKIAAPFSTLSRYLTEISERNFSIKLDFPVDDELTEVFKNINLMAEKLESYDKAQKTFLQNASHEFRTPLMSIQSYAEGIKYDVVDSDTAVAVILEETKRMTNLVEDLLYLSRLDTIDENYHFSSCNISYLIKSCIKRLDAIAVKNDISIIFNDHTKDTLVNIDEEKLSRAITNIVSNDIRYAKSAVTIELEISSVDEGFLILTIQDDGNGFLPDEIPNIFDRFYKGKKGNFGLGLAIAKNVIEKHNGKISAENTETGALFIIKLPILKEDLQN